MKPERHPGPKGRWDAVPALSSMAEWKQWKAWLPIGLGQSPAPPRARCVSEQVTQPAGPCTLRTAMATFHNFFVDENKQRYSIRPMLERNSVNISYSLMRTNNVLQIFLAWMYSSAVSFSLLLCFLSFWKSLHLCLPFGGGRGNEF